MKIRKKVALLGCSAFLTSCGLLQIVPEVTPAVLIVQSECRVGFDEPLKVGYDLNSPIYYIYYLSEFSNDRYTVEKHGFYKEGYWIHHLPAQEIVITPNRAFEDTLSVNLEQQIDVLFMVREKGENAQLEIHGNVECI